MKFSRILALAGVLGVAYVFGVPGLDQLWYKLQPKVEYPAAELDIRDLRLPGFGTPPAQKRYEPVDVPADHHTLRHKLVERQWFGYSRDTTDSPRPTIILLHGSGRSGLAMIDMWRKQADEHGLVLIAPGSFQAKGWKYQNDGPAFLQQVIDAAENSYPIDRENIFVFGHSAGAVFSQMLAERTDGPWRAVVAHAGYMPADWLSGASGTMPMQFLLGDQDGLFAMGGAKQSAEAFAKAGHPTTLVAIQDHTHWYYHKANALNALAWDFFENHMAEQ